MNYEDDEIINDDDDDDDESINRSQNTEIINSLASTDVVEDHFRQIRGSLNSGGMVHRKTGGEGIK